MVATATTTVAAAPHDSKSQAPRRGVNPKDSMKSTWRRDPTQWKWPHKVLMTFNVFHAELDQETPVFQKTDPVPYLTTWSCHAYIILHAVWPILLQQAVVHYTGAPLHPVTVLLLYTVAMQINSIKEVRLLRRIGQKTGFLDGDKHARDDVPDVGVNKVLRAVQVTTTIRPIFSVFLAYKRSMSHSLSWWLPLELALYSVVLDFFFYVYHRSCHELDSLWKYHRTHHLTKHPVPLLSAYADHEQEVLEMVLIPLATWATLKYVFGLPMGYHDWWICHEYIIFSEAFGHSGLRIFATTPSIATPIYQFFGCELAIEDHDLHHRKGWRHSQNYGKQTRVWDRIFGTCGDRIESVYSNVDYVNSINMPLW